MKITEIKSRDWYFSYELWDTMVYNVPDWRPYNIFTETLRYLQWWWEMPKFDENRNINSDIYGKFLIIEYSNKEIRDNDIKNNSKINKINILKSEVIDGTRQVAENIWDFEYNWKYYLVTCPINKLTDEINPEKWLYKWIIVDYDKYYGLNKNVKAEIKETSDKVSDLTS